MHDARRRLEIAQQQLTALLGYREEIAEENSEGREATRSLSEVECRAPFAGTIERKFYSVSERVKPGESLFVLADTRRLWIAADLREREWSLLNLSPDEELTVEFPALPNLQRTARVHYVGREVSADSRAVPLVATIDNADGLLRPGLFVRVTIPGRDVASRLGVPSSAIVEHEREKFVFVQDSADTFRRVDVTTGLEADGLVEITTGLAVGDPVVTRGAFLLKSELLLEGEE
jgi:cobalt-zinc-cadmium efflux system membrane fusion protein